MKHLIKKILLENIRYNDFVISTGGVLTKKQYIKIKQYKSILNEVDSSLVRETQKEIQSYVDSFYPIIGSFIDNNTKTKKSIQFIVDIGYHFAERTFRTLDYPNDNRFVTVNTTEGIDVLITNIDKITKFIVVNKLSNNQIIRLKSERFGITYELLLELRDKSKGNPPVYKISLINQIKGHNVNFNEVSNILKVINPHFNSPQITTKNPLKKEGV
jgi:hypothetical protein